MFDVSVRDEHNASCTVVSLPFDDVQIDSDLQRGCAGLSHPHDHSKQVHDGNPVAEAYQALETEKTECYNCHKWIDIEKWDDHNFSCNSVDLSRESTDSNNNFEFSYSHEENIQVSQQILSLLSNYYYLLSVHYIRSDLKLPKHVSVFCLCDVLGVAVQSSNKLC